ncbi:permease [Shouchella sp. 1P09AA]|uniref:permease n=1 Tax=Bacillaceae TaxID=186817 RepID=UPI0020D10682|nr:permease [Alkalihalobacillus sp. LMS6]UTR06727.1 permease [Alkalihalobacillus sp. LMS6]
MSDVLRDIFLEFLSLSKNLLVLFIGITLFINFIQAYVPFDKLNKWMASKNPIIGNLAGAFLGFVTPFCSCSTFPFLVTMINKKVPFQASMTFLFTSPLLDPWILGLMAYIYGVNVTIIYTISTLIFSMIISWLLDKYNFEKYIKKVAVQGSLPEQDRARRKNLKLNIKESVRETLSLMKTVLVYILIGALIGAIIKEAIPMSLISFIADQNQWWIIPLAAIIGVPLYIRLSTMLPIAQALLVQGFPIAPTMALLIGGAGASLPEIVMLKSIFKTKLVAAFVVSVFLVASFSGYLFLILNF